MPQTKPFCTPLAKKKPDCLAVVGVSPGACAQGVRIQSLSATFPSRKDFPTFAAAALYVTELLQNGHVVSLELVRS